jgi:hypothetical protein
LWVVVQLLIRCGRAMIKKIVPDKTSREARHGDARAGRGARGFTSNSICGSADTLSMPVGIPPTLVSVVPSTELASRLSFMV